MCSAGHFSTIHATECQTLFLFFCPQYFPSRETRALCQQICGAFSREMVSRKGKANDKSLHLRKMDIKLHNIVVRKEADTYVSLWNNTALYITRKTLQIEIRGLYQDIVPSCRGLFLFVVIEKDTLGMLTAISLVSVKNVSRSLSCQMVSLHCCICKEREQESTSVP